MFKKCLFALAITVASLTSCTYFNDTFVEVDPEPFTSVEEDFGLGTKYENTREFAPKGINDGSEGEIPTDEIDDSVDSNPNDGPIEPDEDSYKIVFNVDGQYTSGFYHFGEVPVYTGNNGKDPERESTDEIQYVFVGWEPAIVSVAGPAFYTAVFEETRRMYNITFDIDGNKVVKQFGYNETPNYGSTPTKSSTAQYSYKFSRWEPEITAVREDTTYTAIFEETIRRYNIVFNVEGVTTTKEYEYGQTPSYGSTPTKASTAQYSYTFSHWKINNGSTTYTTLPIVTGAKTYIAVFTSKVRSYTITFDVGGTKTTKTVNYGTVPTYGTSNPTKANDVAGSYKFDGWQLNGTGTTYTTLPAVTGNATYVAKFSLNKRNKYKIKFKLNNYVVQEEEVEYGRTPSYKNAVPIKTGEDGKEQYVKGFQSQTKYIFNGWQPTIGSVKGDQTYTANLTKCNPISTIYCWAIERQGYNINDWIDEIISWYPNCNKRFYITSLNPGFYQWILESYGTTKTSDGKAKLLGSREHNSMSVYVYGPNDVQFTDVGDPLALPKYRTIRYSVLDTCYFANEIRADNGYPDGYEWRYHTAKNLTVKFK